MSTRAVFTFTARTKAIKPVSIYKHHDGHPSGALDAITNALPYAWTLPRFEPDEFAAAFCAGNKPARGGGVYFTTSHNAHGDLDYRYEISAVGQGLQIRGFKRDRFGEAWQCFFTGTLGEFAEHVAAKGVIA